MAVAPITNENHCPNNMSHHAKRKDLEHILLTIFDKELQSSVFFKYFLYLCRGIV